MQHEVAVVLVPVYVVKELLVLDRSKGGYGKALSLSSCEECASVGSGKKSNFAGYWPYLGHLSSIYTNTVVKDGRPEHFVCKVVEELCNLDLSIIMGGDLVCELCKGIGLDLGKCFVSAFLASSKRCLLDKRLCVFADWLEP